MMDYIKRFPPIKLSFPCILECFTRCHDVWFFFKALTLNPWILWCSSRKSFDKWFSCGGDFDFRGHWQCPWRFWLSKRGMPLTSGVWRSMMPPNILTCTEQSLYTNDDTVEDHNVSSAEIGKPHLRETAISPWPWHLVLEKRATGFENTDVFPASDWF